MNAFNHFPAIGRPAMHEKIEDMTNPMLTNSEKRA
jgi:hypothetical protein